MGLFKSIKNLISGNGVKNDQDVNLPKLSKLNLTIHPDLGNLIWIGDGEYRNYKHQAHASITLPYEGFLLKISEFGPNEPSLLYLKYPIEQPDPKESVERPPYYPYYIELTPKQKWLYWKFLSDPYNPSNDIGYVFIFYYGLERHLLYGNFDDAFDVILKLRDVYNNKSFQNYSANALILSAMIHKSQEHAYKFINSLDNDYEFQMPGELYFLCKFGLNIPVNAFDLMKFHKFFGFTNNRYIKNNNHLFFNNLTKAIKNQNDGDDFIKSERYFTKKDLENFQTVSVPVFANVSIRKKEISIPDVKQFSKFMGSMYALLFTAHNDTKKELAKLRKKEKNTLVVEKTEKVQSNPADTIANDFKKLNLIIKERTTSLGLPCLEILPKDFIYDGQNPSYFEKLPLTKTGKLPKFKEVFHYRTKNYDAFNPEKNYFGDIYYLQDGSIGKTRMIFWINHTMYCIFMKIIDRTLCVNKIEYLNSNSQKEILYKADSKNNK